ncbi:MAG: DUF3127 domain-containing protein [Bacteroidales bacterium]|nr:DUF3127 domain-containing protein [Bacteroidales bacterium]
MEITGRLIKILPETRGESTRGPWVRSGFVIETEETYPKMLAFSSLGEDRAAMLGGLPMNGLVSVTFVPESRSYTDRNGTERWSTDLRFLRVETLGSSTPAAQPAPSAPTQAAPAQNPGFAQTPQMPKTDNDDLPF